MKNFINSFKESKFLFFFKNLYSKLEETHRKGKKWIGVDGLANMETFALLVIVFTIVFPLLTSIALNLFLSGAKCFIDKLHGHDGEAHDLICALIGIVFGALIALII